MLLFHGSNFIPELDIHFEANIFSIKITKQLHFWVE